MLKCNLHGVFMQTPHMHLKNKHSCPNCAHIERSKTHKNCNPYCDAGEVYYVKFTHKISKKTFYKIGITKRGIEKRFEDIKAKYDIDVLDVFKTTIAESYCIEQYILDKFKEYRATDIDPSFSGRTECFTEDVLKESTIKGIYDGE